VQEKDLWDDETRLPNRQIVVDSHWTKMCSGFLWVRRRVQAANLLEALKGVIVKLGSNEKASATADGWRQGVMKGKRLG
jgi:hypothetical protein